MHITSVGQQVLGNFRHVGLLADYVLKSSFVEKLLQVPTEAQNEIELQPVTVLQTGT